MVDYFGMYYLFLAIEDSFSTIIDSRFVDSFLIERLWVYAPRRGLVEDVLIWMPSIDCLSCVGELEQLPRQFLVYGDDDPSFFI